LASTETECRSVIRCGHTHESIKLLPWPRLSYAVVLVDLLRDQSAERLFPTRHHNMLFKRSNSEAMPEARALMESASWTVVARPQCCSRITRKRNVARFWTSSTNQSSELLSARCW